MAYKIKGKWQWNENLTDIQVPYTEINYTVNDYSTIYEALECYPSTDFINYFYGGKSSESGNWLHADGEYSGMDFDNDGEFDGWGNTSPSILDFGIDGQTTSKEFCDAISIWMTPIDGEIIDDSIIPILITSPEGVTLATEKTIINKNIKVTIDESLIGDYNSGYADGQESITKNIEVIEKTVTGNGAVRLDDVSEVPHKIQVQISNDDVDDISAVKVQRYGKNLLPYPYTANSKTINNVTFTVNEDGSVLVDGTATAKTVFNLWSQSTTTQLITNTDVDLFLSGCPASGSATTYYIFDSWTGIKDSGSGYSLTKNQHRTKQIQIVVESGVTMNNVLFRPQLEIGTGKTDYEPYTEPTEYTVNADGSVEIERLYPCTTLMADAHIVATYQQSYGIYRMLVELNDNRQGNGTRTDYSYAYYRYDSDWFYPSHDIIPTWAGSTFRQMVGQSLDLTTRLLECGVILDMSTTTAITYCFYNAPVFTRLPEINTTSASDLTAAFGYCKNLHTIDKVILKDDGSQKFMNTFTGDYALQNIIIEGIIGQNGFNVQHATKLSKASIQNIINALSTTTSGLTVTFSLKAVKNAFETSTGAADGNTSDEWKALTATRSNWTFSLV